MFNRPPDSPENALEEPPEDLQRHVLERQRRPVEQLQELEVAEIHHRHHIRMVEGGERVRDQAIEVVAGNVVNVEPEDLLR